MTTVRKSLLSLALAATVLAVLAPAVSQAGTFRRTRTMVISYAWGTMSLAEFDMFEAMYPGALPTADVTFYTDGTFDAVDNASGNTGGGVYDKRGRNLEITIIPDGPLGTVQYVGRRVGRGVWEGEIKVNGTTWGHWRGRF